MSPSLNDRLDGDGTRLPRTLLLDDLAATFRWLSGDADAARHVSRHEVCAPIANVRVAVGSHSVALIIDPVETAGTHVLPIREHDPVAVHLVGFAGDLLTDDIVDRHSVGRALSGRGRGPNTR